MTQQVHIPRVSPSGAVTMVRPSSDADTLESIVSSSSAADKVMTLRNKVIVAVPVVLRFLLMFVTDL
jgi:hypothetical protein